MPSRFEARDGTRDTRCHEARHIFEILVREIRNLIFFPRRKEGKEWKCRIDLAFALLDRCPRYGDNGGLLWQPRCGWGMVGKLAELPRIGRVTAIEDRVRARDDHGARITIFDPLTNLLPRLDGSFSHFPGRGVKVCENLFQFSRTGFILADVEPKTYFPTLERGKVAIRAIKVPRHA